eukprot:1087574-Prorocentrum_minimum.AAC.1
MAVEGTDEASVAQLLSEASDNPADPAVHSKLGGAFALCIYPDIELLGGSNIGPVSCYGMTRVSYAIAHHWRGTALHPSPLQN